MSLINVFAKESWNLIIDIHGVTDSGNPESARTKAHAPKGGAAMFGAAKLATAARELEWACDHDAALEGKFLIGTLPSPPHVSLSALIEESKKVLAQNV